MKRHILKTLRVLLLIMVSALLLSLRTPVNPPTWADYFLLPTCCNINA